MQQHNQLEICNHIVGWYVDALLKSEQYEQVLVYCCHVEEDMRKELVSALLCALTEAGAPDQQCFDCYRNAERIMSGWYDRQQRDTAAADRGESVAYPGTMHGDIRCGLTLT